MSRIGNKPVALPKNVQINVQGSTVAVKGPKGELSAAVPAGVRLETVDGEARVHRQSEDIQTRSNHGLMRALLANMVQGVTQGFEKQLEIVGVGYRVEQKGNSLLLNLGYSHPINYPFPPGITVTMDGPGKMSVRGIDKEKVGQVASELRSLRPPDSYKGKGIRYAGERVRLKAGKSGQ